MVRKGLLVSFFLLSGCDIYSQDKVLDKELATDIINKKVSTSCLSSKIDLTDTLSFNTLRRHYDANEDKMKNHLPRDIITLAKDTDEIKNARMEYLTQLGFFEKIGGTIYVGKRGIRGYYFAPIDYHKGEKNEELTYEDEGTQYRLTEKGGGYIDMSSVPMLHVCVGKVRVNNVVVYDYGDMTADRIRATFTTEIYDTPRWIENGNTKLIFPVVIQNLGRFKEKSEGMVYIVKHRNKFIIENDKIIYTK